MAIVYLIRHGRAAASFTDDLDPGLDDLGRSQAEQASLVLQNHLPLEIRSSPLARAQETAAPLARVLGQDVTIEDRLAEIPSPGMSLEERGPWLRNVMAGSWSDQAAELVEWHQKLVECLLDMKTDTAIFSHFVAINAAVGAAEGNDRVILFRPDNGSITRIETANGVLTMLSRGDEAQTKVN